MGQVSYEPLIRDMVWSYSRLKSFEDCPYRWYLKYIRFPKGKKKHMFFSDYGVFVHELIADVYSGKRSAQSAGTEYLLKFRSKVIGRAPNQRIFDSYFHDGLNYFRSCQVKNRVLSVEDRNEFSVGGLPFLGIIDRLEEDEDGGIILVDNKSRNLKPRSTRKQPTKGDEELDSYLRQLYLYAIPVREKFGRFPKKLCFDCFRSQTRVEEEFLPEKLEETKAWVADTVETIAKEEEFRPNMEFFKCNYLCEMQGLCDYYQMNGGDIR